MSSAHESKATRKDAAAASCRSRGRIWRHGSSTDIFRDSAPFASRKEKKSEFPDASSLLLLEAYARDHGTKGIVASKDSGWSDFAANSEYLYCVKSIDELIALFEASGEHAKTVKDRVVAAINDEDSAVRAALYDELQHHVSEASWEVDDAYSVVWSHALKLKHMRGKSPAID